MFPKLLSILWLGFWIILAVSSLLEVPRQISKDKIFLEKEIKPPVEFVKAFKLENYRLPTDKEFYKWQESSASASSGVTYIRSSNNILGGDKSKFEGANWAKDFAIGVWRGEWEEYYFSWSDKYDTNNYTWKDGIEELIFCIIVGIIPLVIFQLFKWRIRIKSSSTKI